MSQRLIYLVIGALLFCAPWVLNATRHQASNTPSQDQAARAYQAGMEFSALVEAPRNAK